MKDLVIILNNIRYLLSGKYHSNNSTYNDYKDSLYDSFSHIPKYNDDKMNRNNDMRNILYDLNKSISLKK